MPKLPKLPQKFPNLLEHPVSSTFFFLLVTFLPLLFFLSPHFCISPRAISFRHLNPFPEPPSPQPIVFF
ncbi:hypothetical protein PMG11_10276 [Penicillium brasilianum]|uniref:Uncharacterized protein n=1 Tax=Penicillium brasilianum TaxID=104259 RepID=A0A0F7U0I6_PENBI|nr:hypothetical protein PMG11_10276 [Penicillium brasilianum]